VTLYFTLNIHLLLVYLFHTNRPSSCWGIGQLPHVITLNCIDLLIHCKSPILILHRFLKGYVLKICQKTNNMYLFSSPHVGITLPQHLTVTPSGAPRTNIKFVAVPDYQNSIRITLKRAITRTSPYEPQLAHSTGLPKPPGYNLEWSRVTLIQDTLVTGPPAKSSHHDHPLKRCRKLSSCIITGPKPPSAHHTSLGGT